MIWKSKSKDLLLSPGLFDLLKRLGERVEELAQEYKDDIMDERIKNLLIFIAREMEVEPMSGMFPGGPYWNISVAPLLDQIGKEFNISKDEIGQIVNSEREKVESALS